MGLQILAVVAIFSGVHSAASSEDIEQAKAKLLDLYSKVESSLDSGVQKLSKDFTTQLDSTSKAMKTKFEEHKEKFANSEYARYHRHKLFDTSFSFTLKF